MTTTVPAKTTAALKTDLHGERLGTDEGVHCDLCSEAIDCDAPLVYEAIHLVDLEALQTAIGLPDMWVLDAARCRTCAEEPIEPATGGIEEALIELSIVEANGTYSADTTALEVHSFIPADTGYHPPLVTLETILELKDLGLTRWHRLRLFVESANNESAEVLTPVRQCIEHSLEIPPSVDAALR
jgi:hypothetical protein